MRTQVNVKWFKMNSVWGGGGERGKGSVSSCRRLQRPRPRSRWRRLASRTRLDRSTCQQHIGLIDRSVIDASCWSSTASVTVVGRTELSVILGRIHPQDIRNDTIYMYGSDQRSEEEFFHEARLERPERWQPQQQSRKPLLGHFVPRLRHVSPQLFHRLLLETLHLAAGRSCVICNPISNQHIKSNPTGWININIENSSTNQS